MGVQFGRWNVDGKAFEESYLEKVKSIISPYGPDSCTAYSKGHTRILYHAFHTSEQSRRDTQPFVSASGAVITWDGRLDNSAELIRDLGDMVVIGPTDVEIVAAAYERWGTDSLARLVGDWALAIWNGDTKSLILAKDFLGLRPLYYSTDKHQVTWSTILDPLVLLEKRTYTLSEEYIAGWLSFFPAAHLTPYVGIHAVPPASFVLLRPEVQTARKYWDFDPSKRIRYGTDSEYEEHFRTVFAGAVRRRLRSDSPILAELSGGMDSSSIVCMADLIMASGAAETPRVDTVSYYNDSEPNWQERPYFSKVEEKRGRTGCHIDLAAQEMFKFERQSVHFEATPDHSAARPSQAQKQFAALMESKGYRVVLSGIGGDEVTGGVPTPTPEHQDLLTRVQFSRLAHQLKVWALAKRVPWFHLLRDAVRDFLPLALIGVTKSRQPAAWLHPDFVKRNRPALEGYERRLSLFGPLPSFQANICTLDHLRRQLACSATTCNPPYERRYPFLDRDLLEFTYRIPREQLARPGRRRSLMRRALFGIVPTEILERKRKAFVARATRSAITTEWAILEEWTREMSSAAFGIVEPTSFYASLQKARNSEEVPLVRLMRTIATEVWLRHVRVAGILVDTREQTQRSALDLPAISVLTTQDGRR